MSLWGQFLVPPDKAQSISWFAARRPSDEPEQVAAGSQQNGSAAEPIRFAQAIHVWRKARHPARVNPPYSGLRAPSTRVAPAIPETPPQPGCIVSCSSEKTGSPRGPSRSMNTRVPSSTKYTIPPKV